MPHLEYDVLIIGSGAAGLTLALSLDSHFRIAILCKDDAQQSASYYAQGGIAAALDQENCVLHKKDTLTAGVGLCNEPIVDFTVKHSKSAIDWLVEQGVDFTHSLDKKNNRTYHLTQEGGHCCRRIFHADDSTGKAIIDVLYQQVEKRSNIVLLTHYYAVDLLVSHRNTPDAFCYGATVFSLKTQRLVTIQAKASVIATGGFSGIFLHNTSKSDAFGDGIAMAWRANCTVQNLEFTQFHPTKFYHNTRETFLISEAVRGEGGVLRLPNGERFMAQFDPRAELAPRDIVARAIDHEMKRLNIPCVYLDISHCSSESIKKRFPTIYEMCKRFGNDMTVEPIPVVPAAHYSCGGISIDRKAATNIRGIYAVGEASCTGLHGANRLASNSLLECVVFAREGALSISEYLTNDSMKSYIVEDQCLIAKNKTAELRTVSAIIEQIKQIMWTNVGIVRSISSLKKALSQILLLRKKAETLWEIASISKHMIELNNMILVAELTIRCALQRKESRGAQYVLEYPQINAHAKDTLLKCS